MATDAEGARATLGLCALVGTMLAVFGVVGMFLTSSDEAEVGAGSAVALVGFALGGLLLLVAATGWAVSLGVRAAGHDRGGVDAG